MATLHILMIGHEAVLKGPRAQEIKTQFSKAEGCSVVMVSAPEELVKRGISKQKFDYWIFISAGNQMPYYPVWNQYWKKIPGTKPRSAVVSDRAVQSAVMSSFKVEFLLLGNTSSASFCTKILNGAPSEITAAAMSNRSPTVSQSKMDDDPLSDALPQESQNTAANPGENPAENPAENPSENPIDEWVANVDKEISSAAVEIGVDPATQKPKPGTSDIDPSALLDASFELDAPSSEVKTEAKPTEKGTAKSSSTLQLNEDILGDALKEVDMADLGGGESKNQESADSKIDSEADEFAGLLGEGFSDSGVPEHAIHKISPKAPPSKSTPKSVAQSGVKSEAKVAPRADAKSELKLKANTKVTGAKSSVTELPKASPSTSAKAPPKAPSKVPPNKKSKDEFAEEPRVDADEHQATRVEVSPAVTDEAHEATRIEMAKPAASPNTHIKFDADEHTRGGDEGRATVVDSRPTVVDKAYKLDPKFVSNETRSMVIGNLESLGPSTGTAASSGPEGDTLRRYAALRERESRERDVTIQVLNKELAQIKEKLNRSETERRRIMLELDESRVLVSSLEDARAQHQNQLRKLDQQFNERQKSLQLRLDNAQFAASRAEKRLEEFRERVRSDILRIRLRERELANKLELQKRDAEALLTAKDERLLAQKREIDRLEYEMEMLKERMIDETGKAEERAAKLSRALQSLKMAQGMLAGIEEEVIPTSDNRTPDDGEAA